MARNAIRRIRIQQTILICMMIALCHALTSLSHVDNQPRFEPPAVSGNTSATGTRTLTSPPGIPADPTATSSPQEETASSTATSTTTQSPTQTPPSSFPPYAVLINEIAWAGTLASAYDEWIELFNPGTEVIDLSGWLLEDSGDISIPLTGIIAPRSLYLLERTDDTTISDIRADLIYTGSLNNGGETLVLKDPSGAIVDTANIAGGSWPAGDAGTRASMERLGGGDQPGNWRTWNGRYAVGHDSAGNPIAGTPHQATSLVWEDETTTPTSTPTGASPFPTLTTTQTSTRTPTPSSTPVSSFPPFSIMINEVAWAGTLASVFDEWIELINPGEEPIDLTGWSLDDGGDISIALSGVIAPHSLYLLERTDDTTVATIRADLFFSGGLNNGGETLWLKDPTGAVIDSANAAGGSWPAGNAQTRASMERRGGGDRPDNWGTWRGPVSSGYDAGGNPIAGTPRQANSVLYPTPAPTSIPGRVVINEVLIRPHYDWNRSGEADLGDEFIELFNAGPGAVNLSGWILDDIAGGGSGPYSIPHGIILPGKRVAFFRSETRISLNDAGDVVRLMAPDGRVIDQIRYIRVRAYNLSYGRLPDGSSNLAYALWPTPGSRNVAFVEPLPDAAPESSGGLMSEDRWHQCGLNSFPWPLLARTSRHPALLRWMISLGLFVCR